ncbi:MAG: ABC transporter substrate-binding protein [Anaerolineales bacterium]|nr:ABC transporter substrate-binding protein [Anaerolineales bacterium]
MKKNWIVTIVLIIAIFLTACAPSAAPKVIDPVSLGFTAELNYVAIIALEKGYFTEEGLDVTVTEYSSGSKARDGLLNGEVDFSIIGISPLVFTSFDRSDFSIFGSVSTHYDLYKIVARKNSGIQDPADLKGKPIGVSEASSFHYFLHNFALEYGYSENDVELVFTAIADQPTALANEDVDAISTREPYISEAISLLGDNYVIFSQPNLPANTLNLVAMDTFIQEKPQVVEKVLRAMIKAEEFAVKTLLSQSQLWRQNWGLAKKNFRLNGATRHLVFP